MSLEHENKVSALMVLHGQLCGRVERRRPKIEPRSKERGFSFWIFGAPQLVEDPVCGAVGELCNKSGAAPNGCAICALGCGWRTRLP